MLAEDLHQQGLRVWVDNIKPAYEGIRSGDSWQLALADAVQQAAAVILVFSPDSIASDWVRAEIRRAGATGKPVLPILFRPYPEDDTWDSMMQIPLGDGVLGDAHYRNVHVRGYKSEREWLLRDLKDYLDTVAQGVLALCQGVAAEMLERPWGMEHYIREQAQLLPVNASPYADGAVHGEADDLIHLMKEARRLIVLGEPGIGKTVALERFAWELATEDPLIVPVFIELKLYSGEPIIEWIRLRLTGEHLDLPHADATRQFLKDHPVTILLDGLNEVRPAYREAVVQAINRFEMEFSRANIIVTSRVQDESWRRLQGHRAFEQTVIVRPIEESQIKTYLRGHLGDDGDYLWDQLDPLMRGLAQTPLLLWLIKQAWLAAKTTSVTPIMPENRGQLYNSFVRDMMRRGQQADANITERQRSDALCRLALAYHENQTLVMKREQVEQIITDDAVLKAVEVNGLLVGDDVLRFAPHQTIQEYFTALAVRDTAQEQASKRGFARWLQRLSGNSVLAYAGDGWWAETFIQLAGLTDDPNTLARSLADVNPWLAWWCVKEGQQVDAETQTLIEAKSIAKVHSDRVVDRRNAAQTLAQLGTLRVIEPLAQLCFDNDETVCRTALNALFQFGEEGQDAFTAIFDQQITRMEISERVAFGQTLSEIGDPRPGVGLRADGLPDIDWVTIPAGEFTYQDSRMTLDDDFQISRYPVTYAQFQAFIDDSEGFYDSRWWDGLADNEYRHKNQSKPDNQVFKYWNHPRERVSWYDAMAFCRWLSWRLGGGYDLNHIDQWAVRLPTEFEWERAARGTDGLKYPYGNEFDAAKGNTRETGIGQTSAVGTFPNGAAPEGVLDMSGNVWEWCLSDYKNPAQMAAEENISSHSRRVLRGGSWNLPNYDARAVYRNNYNPNSRLKSDGFRLCRPPSL